MKKLAAQERIGVGVTIDPSAQFVDVEYLSIGDHSYIGPDVRVIGGRLEIGEYSKVHNNCYLFPKNGITLGDCTWLGQGVHLDGTGGINAGDFLGVGINSALYSHIRHGDITEGCQFEKNGKLEIGHDVWFVGMCLVSPVKVHDKSMALLGSVITKEMKANRVYAGNPAIDITKKTGPGWIDYSVERKITEVQNLVDYFFKNVRPDLNRDAIVVSDSDLNDSSGRTVYNLSMRTYSKNNSIEEIALNKWLFGYRAKFRPKYQNANSGVETS